MISRSQVRMSILLAVAVWLATGNNLVADNFAKTDVLCRHLKVVSFALMRGSENWKVLNKK